MCQEKKERDSFDATIGLLEDYIEMNKDKLITETRKKTQHNIQQISQVEVPVV